jgi:4-aminobutyrate aminotransferase-like enzyme
MPILSTRGEILRRNVVKVKPPLIINNEDTDFIMEKFEVILKEAVRKVG